MNYDGKVVISTALDNKGLEKGIKGVSGKLGGLTKVVGKSALAITAAFGAAAVATTKQAVDAYADYEQLTGGIQTLFKNAATKIAGYAEDAFYTAGVSGNKYMEIVTSFSASLISSLAGDTEKAADVANMALIDMSDNANKMGTAMELIQNAYQGFAKQNYTMLDNLKLGYGGTKTEMQRLLKDAEALSGVKYDINNLSDVYKAIHAIQEKLGIAGATAAKAEDTITGSANMTKAAWQNVLVAISGGGDLDKAINNLVYSISKYFDNIVPVVERSLYGIGQLIERIAPKLVQTVATALIKAIPSLLNAVYQIIVGLVNGIYQGIISFFSGKGSSSEVSLKLNSIASSADEAADATFGLADATEAAGKAAKKSLAGFDELNTLADQSSGSAGTGGQISVSGGGGGGTVTAGVSADKFDADKVFDLKQIGKDIGKLVNKVDWEDVFSVIGTAISTVLEGGFDSITEIAAGVDWATVGSELISGLGGAIEDNIPDLLQSGATAATMLVWSLGELIWGVLVDIFTPETWTDHIFPFIGNCLNGIGKGVAEGVMRKLKPDGKTSLWDAILSEYTRNGVASDDLWSVFEEFGATMDALYPLNGWYQGFFEGIKTGIDSFINDPAGWFKTNIGDPIVEKIRSTFGESVAEFASDPSGWFKTHVADPIMNAIKSVFGLGEGDTPVTLADGKNLIAGFFDGIGESVKEFATNPSGWFKKNVGDPVANAFKAVFGLESGESTVTNGYGKGIISGLKSGLTDSTGWDSISRGLETAWQTVETWWSGTALSGILDDITEFFKDPDWSCLSNLSTLFGGAFKDAANAAIDALNDMIDWVNKKMKFTIPEMELMGSQLWPETKVTLAKLPKIPKLAQGAVLPPNQPFMAIVGDQRHGTNVEAPLSTIQEAVAVVMQDFISSNMAGHEATVAVLREILEAVLGIQIGDEVIASAYDRYKTKMAIVRGG